jgi:hypothetical protein
MDKPYTVPATPEKTLFPLGALVITSAAAEELPRVDVAHAINRHAAGLWGDLSEKDRVANETALKHGGRILSAYGSTNGITFWVITEADRSATTVLLPADY